MDASWFELSKAVGKLKDFDGVVLAHHGLIVWDDDSDFCLAKTPEAVEKAEQYLNSLSKRPNSEFVHSELPDSELASLLLKIRGELGRKQLLKVDTRLAEVASRGDVATVVAAGVSSADHMLRIRPRSAVISIDDPASGISEYRENYQTYFDSNKNLLPQGFSSHGNDPRVLLVPKVGAVITGSTLAELKTSGGYSAPYTLSRSTSC
ncbi:MAG: hypothetical protein WDO06_00690 [Actinomycetota bacterium]